MCYLVYTKIKHMNAVKGRKYETDAERMNAQRAYRKRYYQANKARIDEQTNKYRRDHSSGLPAGRPRKNPIEPEPVPTREQIAVN